MDRAIEDAKQAYLDELAVGSLINAIRQAPSLLSEARLVELAASLKVKEARAAAEAYRSTALFLNQAKIAEGKNAEARKDIAASVLAKDRAYQDKLDLVVQAEVAHEQARIRLSVEHDRFSAQKNQARLIAAQLNYLA